MNCADYEIRDYFLGELPEAERQRTARHVHSCSYCSGELEQLRHLRLALESLPDQEPPQRIGFVSDKVFEPSRTRRVWSAFWNSAPRLGFASAAMLSAALVALALRPAPPRLEIQPQVAVTSPAPGQDLAVLVERAVQKAVAETEERQQKRTELLLSVAQRRHEQEQRELMLRVADSYSMAQKRMMYSRASLLNYGGETTGSSQQ